MIPIIQLQETEQLPQSRRKGADTSQTVPVVQEIIDTVKEKKDQALREYTEKFDQVVLPDFRVGASEIDEAFTLVDPVLLEIMKKAKKNIEKFHERQLPRGFMIADEPGIVTGQRVIPLAKVGVYVPGGTAAYPSTVLMDVIPAKIAGVGEIVMITPPGKDGKIPPVILAAAKIAGVSKIYKVGGAQGIAALAYGTETIPRVDKIVGPGNIFVATAKKLVYGQVDIDMIAGPSDILIVADDSAKAHVVAADLLGQAEHDKNAQAILVTTNEVLAKAVQNEVACQLENLPRKAIAEVSVQNNSRIYLVQSIKQALKVANEIAPEHLELCLRDPFTYLPIVKNAGSVFLGNFTPEVLGDYFAGPNHTLPTEGTSRFYSPLSVEDFLKRSSYLYYSSSAMQDAAHEVMAFAEAEGLSGHARSIASRINEEGKK
ncbi:MAG: histidinol dehydrogenase [Enterococcaceae bacterium]|jgi:histidinol dehydrogenase|nr:histidinol dehydrogenase [Enterococcaceae bacterium]MCI1918847.1 histidinol dehydrogenase [Enterococcaceae bacterium]